MGDPGRKQQSPLFRIVLFYKRFLKHVTFGLRINFEMNSYIILTCLSILVCKLSAANVPAANVVAEQRLEQHGKQHLERIARGINESKKKNQEGNGQPKNKKQKERKKKGKPRK